MTDQSTLFAADILASHSVLPGTDAARKMTVTSGRKCIGSWLSTGPLGCLERTLLGTSAWGSTRCYLTWKTKVTPAGYLLFRLAPSMPRIDETEPGLWPTPHGFSKDGRSNGPSGNELGRAVNQSFVPTPSASAATQGQNDPDGKRGQTLVGAARGQLWATPQARDHMPAHRPEYVQAKRAQGHGMRNPNDEVAMLPTPHARDWRSGKGKTQEERGRSPGSASLPETQGGSLNPQWVEWLMGFPPGWTDLKPSETPSSRGSLK